MDPWPGQLAAPATRHPYAYGLNAPVMYGDPSGRQVLELWRVMEALREALAGLLGAWLMFPGTPRGDVFSDRFVTRGERIVYHGERLLPPPSQCKSLEQVLVEVYPPWRYFLIFRELQPLLSELLSNWLFAGGSYETVEDAQRIVKGWGVEGNLTRINQHHQEVVRIQRLRYAEQMEKWKLGELAERPTIGGVVREVQNARRGLKRAWTAWRGRWETKRGVRRRASTCRSRRCASRRPSTRWTRCCTVRSSRRRRRWMACLEEDERSQAFREEQDRLRALSCSELRGYLEERWDTVLPGRREYVLSIMVDKQCQEAVPYLVRQLRARDSHARIRATWGLSKLGRRELRPELLKLHLRDKSPRVRRETLVWLSAMFEGEADAEILRLALDAYDDPRSSVVTRVLAGGAMILQLDVPRELGSSGWWNEQKAALGHPALQWAVAEARRIVGSRGGTGNLGQRRNAR